ncbi:MAG TPA: hypothetical protein VM509_14425 [Planctomycetota bacterium]|nr:hypothetical protein [Planctomycetota bacterium]
MNPDCHDFRLRLAEALRLPSATIGGELAAPALGAALGLGWHAHVIHCGECRELLAEEEALDELLRSLPVPQLPRALAERVLSRLDAVRRGVDLDQLLDLELAAPAPANLARGVIERVHAEARLDRLLDRVPAAKAPAGLEQRVLAKLSLARRAKTARVPTASRSAARNSAPVSTPVIHSKVSHRQLALRVAAGFALASIAAWGAWSLRRAFLEQGQIVPPDLVQDPRGTDAIGVTPKVAVGPRVTVEPPAPVPPVAPVGAQPDDELLASLEIFEAWDILSTSGGADASLSTLDSLDEYLLDFESSNSGSSTTPVLPDESKTPKKNG